MFNGNIWTNNLSCKIKIQQYKNRHKALKQQMNITIISVSSSHHAAKETSAWSLLLVDKDYTRNMHASTPHGLCSVLTGCMLIIRSIILILVPEASGRFHAKCCTCTCFARGINQWCRLLWEADALLLARFLCLGNLWE